MKYSELREGLSRFLNVDTVTEPRRLTIRAVRREPVYDADERDLKLKPILYFEECPKGMHLTYRNANRLAAFASSEDVEDWVGIRVEIAVEEYIWQGNPARALRIYPLSPFVEDAGVGGIVIPK